MTEKSKLERQEEFRQPLDDSELGPALEAVLFAAGYPVEIGRLCAVFSRDKRDMKRFLASLKMMKFVRLI